MAIISMPQANIRHPRAKAQESYDRCRARVSPASIAGALLMTTRPDRRVGVGNIPGAEGESSFSAAKHFAQPWRAIDGRKAGGAIRWRRRPRARRASAKGHRTDSRNAEEANRASASAASDSKAVTLRWAFIRGARRRRALPAYHDFAPSSRRRYMPSISAESYVASRCRIARLINHRRTSAAAPASTCRRFIKIGRPLACRRARYLRLALPVYLQ